MASSSISCLVLSYKFNIGAEIITHYYTILGAPYYIYGITGPKTLF